VKTSACQMSNLTAALLNRKPFPAIEYSINSSQC